MRHLLLKATTVEQKKQSQKEDERINAQEMFSLYEEILREMIVLFLPNLVVISYILIISGQPYIILWS